jgi:hypothetical protein
MHHELAMHFLMQNPPMFVSRSDTWTDGDEPNGFSVGGPTIRKARSFELGVGAVDPWTLAARRIEPRACGIFGDLASALTDP